MFKNIILLVCVLCLNSCSWYKCEAQSKIFFFRSPLSIAYKGSTLGNTQLPISADYYYLISPEIINLVAQKIDKTLADSNSLSEAKLAKEIDAEILGGTNAVILSYKDLDPKVAAKVVNTWIDIIQNKYDETLEEYARNKNYLLKENLPQNYIININNNKLAISPQHYESREDNFYFNLQEYDRKNVLTSNLFESSSLRLSTLEAHLTKANIEPDSGVIEIEIYPRNALKVVQNTDVVCPRRRFLNLLAKRR